MIDFQDISVFDIPKETQVKEQRVIDFERKSLISYSTTYTVKNPKKPVIVEPQTESVSPIIVVDETLSLLNSDSILVKKNAIFKIREKLKTKEGLQFLDVRITDALFCIVDEDISSLKDETFLQKKLRKNIRKKLQQGKTVSEKQFEKAYKISDKELAKHNKIFALFTIAEIQNLLYTELEKRANIKPNFYDMPAVERLISVYKNNPDEEIKDSAKKALTMMYRAEFDKDFETLFKK